MYYICNDKLDKMQERFKQLLEEKKLTATRFAALIKVNASAMSHILNGRSKPGFDVLDKIAQAFPDVNLNWLISGKGSLYNNSSVQEYAPEKATVSSTPSEKKELPSPVSSVKNREETQAMPIALTNKKIKRIILFFEDGSFEDYEK